MSRFKSRQLWMLLAALGWQIGSSHEAMGQYVVTEAKRMTPTIDGVPNEWPARTPNTPSTLRMSWAHNERSGAADSAPLIVDIQYAWDDANFYALVEEVSDDDPTSGYSDVDWCIECNGSINGPMAPWTTDSVGFYDKGIKWPNSEQDETLETGPYTQFWVGLTTKEDLTLNGQKQYRHMTRTVNDSKNEDRTGRLIGPRSEENAGATPLIPELEELTKPQSAFAVIEGPENGGRGRRVVEFSMSWKQIRYDANDPRQEVRDRIDELGEALTGHLLQDVKAGYEFRLDPLLVDGTQDFTWGSQTHPSGMEHPQQITNGFGDISVVRLLGSAIAGDFDQDGDVDATDIDALSAAIRQGQGAGFDVNSDGSVNASDKTYLVEQIKKTYLGDANLDGQFNTTDLVSVFQVGEYEDGVAQNSGWADGDWTGDQEFDTGDFVAAFQAGGFEMGPRAATEAVPEPVVSGVGLMLILGAWGSTRRR